MSGVVARLTAVLCALLAGLILLAVMLGTLTNTVQLAFLRSTADGVRVMMHDMHSRLTVPLTSHEFNVYSFDIAPDGERLAFTGDLHAPGGLEQHAYIMALPRGTPQRINGTHPPFVRDVLWSPDGQTLLLAVPGTQDPDTQTVFLYQLDDERTQPLLTAPPMDMRDVVFTPSGDAIAFTYRTRGGDSDLMQSELTPFDARALISDTGGERMPSFSPDGERLAFYSYTGPTSALYIADASGDNPRRIELPHNLHSSIKPAWSPDGQTVAVGVFSLEVSNFDQINRVVLVNAATGEHQLLNGAEATDLLMTFTPDGRQILVQSLVPASGYGLTLIDTQTGTRTPLARPAGRDYRPRWVQ